LSYARPAGVMWSGHRPVSPRRAAVIYGGERVSLPVLPPPGVRDVVQPHSHVWVQRVRLRLATALFESAPAPDGETAASEATRRPVSAAPRRPSR
jgi:hypothetical protein